MVAAKGELNWSGEVTVEGVRPVVWDLTDLWADWSVEGADGRIGYWNSTPMSYEKFAKKAKYWLEGIFADLAYDHDLWIPAWALTIDTVRIYNESADASGTLFVPMASVGEQRPARLTTEAKAIAYAQETIAGNMNICRGDLLVTWS